MAEEEFMSWAEGNDGTPDAMLPPDHLDRVRSLTIALMSADGEKQGRLKILEVKGDPNLDRAYAAVVIQESLELYFRWLTTSAETFVRGFQMPRLAGYVHIAKSPLLQDVIIETMEEEFDGE